MQFNQTIEETAISRAGMGVCLSAGPSVKLLDNKLQILYRLGTVSHSMLRSQRCGRPFMSGMTQYVHIISMCLCAHV